jgi:hypothetical protein
MLPPLASPVRSAILFLKPYRVHRAMLHSKARKQAQLAPNNPPPPLNMTNIWSGELTFGAQSHTGGQPSAGGQVLYKNSLQCFTHTVRHFGPAAVFRGTLITAIRDVNYGQWFAQYEWTKRWLMSQHEEGESKMFPICEN